MFEPMSRDIKILRDEQHECDNKISKLREENESVRKGNEQIKAENEKRVTDGRMDYLGKVNKQNNIKCQE